MNKILLSAPLIVAIICITICLLSSCTSAKKSIVPLSDQIAFEDTHTIIWNGYSKAFVYKDNNWQRAEAFDYYFNVSQKRYAKEWKSVKTLQRIHPMYNGKAGKREQAMYFEVKYDQLKDNVLSASIQSSLGNGTLTTDREFRHSTIEIDIPKASKFSPYNKIRITQHYDYENGKLTETVLLYKLKNGIEIPFMKNEEEAYFYTKSTLDKAPSIF